MGAARGAAWGRASARRTFRGELDSHLARALVERGLDDLVLLDLAVAVDVEDRARRQQRPGRRRERQRRAGRVVGGGGVGGRAAAAAAAVLGAAVGRQGPVALRRAAVLERHDPAHRLVEHDEPEVEQAAGVVGDLGGRQRGRAQRHLDGGVARRPADVQVCHRTFTSDRLRQAASESLEVSLVFWRADSCVARGPGRGVGVSDGRSAVGVVCDAAASIPPLPREPSTVPSHRSRAQSRRTIRPWVCGGGGAQSTTPARGS